MKNDGKKWFILSYLFVFSLLGGRSEVEACSVNDGAFDLTPIQKWNTWVFKTDKLGSSSSMSTFYMNLCNNVRGTVAATQCSSDTSSICLKQENIYTNVGTHNGTITATANEGGGGFRLDYRGGVCSSVASESTAVPEMWQTTIEFKCDKTLGSPIFIGQSNCTYFFEWHSTVACKSSPAVNEVRCSLYDNNYKKRDLSPLIKERGGYKVDSHIDAELYINVCRDITPFGPTASCLSGSAGCTITNTTQADGTVTSVPKDVGQPDHELQWVNNNRLQLTYTSKTRPSGCRSLPQVTILFECPREGGRNEGNQNPKLISSINCNYEVEWITEYACEADMLTTSDCKFSKDIHGIDLDLSVLTKDPGTYTADNDASYRYFMDVCSDMGIPCGNRLEKGAVCQEDKSNNYRSVAGVDSKHVLSYSDGELTLTYKWGDICDHNGFQRTSIISFECNQTASDSGKGSPVFVTETECSYFFEWQTKYACLDHLVGKSCRVDHGGQHYDLSPLTHEVGSNWQALSGPHEESSEDGHYFINVCADILPENNCPDNSAACFVPDKAGSTAVSLGEYKESPVFRNGHLTLTYYNGSTDGSSTCNGRVQTVITFTCAYGDLESAPSFVRKSLDQCLYEFEWRTAAACPLGHKWGTDCRVFDDDAGFSFDLSRLTTTTNYTVVGDDYTYLLNVCGALSGTPCNVEGNEGVAACQVQNTGERTWALGKVNTSLEYFDGILKLTYLDGEAYHSTGDEEGPKRRTEIEFLCAPDQDPGKLEFKYEASNAYVFNWFTKYACPEEPIECVVTNEDQNDHNQYDLSSLSKSLEEENWSFVDDSDPHGDRKKYYINVCRPINPVKGCGAFAGVCQTEFNNDEESVVLASMGVPKSQPEIESEGHILLTYVNGSVCGENKRVESRIHFSCRKGALGSSPRLLEKVNDCLYSFIWETEAACPIDKAKGEDCTVKDPNSEYVFNMGTLTKPDGSYYTVTGPDNSLVELNICGNVTGGTSECGTNEDKGVPSACIIKSDTSVDFIGFPANQKLEFSDNGLLKLTYEGQHLEGGYMMMTEITFLCRHNVSFSAQKPVFHRRENNNYIFNFETPLACLPESVDCLVSDDTGNQYDLSPLAKDDGNWEAVDMQSGVKYYINVCRPVNSVTSETHFCPGGPIGACQTTSDDKAFNMGYVQAVPEAAQDGSLSIHYVNGDICHGQYHRSTRINFECSDTPGSPVFQLETERCEYIFSWQTPAACPLKRVLGAECKVQVPNFEFEYDLSALHNEQADYVVSVPPYEYRINVCGPLVHGEGDCTGADVGACQKKTTDQVFEKIAGNFNKNLQYNDGTLKLNYTSGDKNCHQNTYERSTAINFFCDEGVKGNGQPTFINEDSDCTYVFEWATPLACPPFKVIECSYSDNDHEFDLAPLARVDDNYRINPMATVGNDVYYINVCRSLLHKKGSQGQGCPLNAAACLFKDDKYVSLGEVSQGPTMENGHLVLRYESGDPCSDGGKKSSAIISLECDKEGVGSTPQYSYTSDNCEYYFIWLTNLACDINEQEDVTDDCTAVNPATGFKFDINLLKSSHGYLVHSDKGHQYNFSVCAPLDDSVCGRNVGSCQTEVSAATPRHFNSGAFNSQLHYYDGTLFLNYEGGEPCHNNAFTRSTVINFVCSLEKDAIGEPVFVDESADCTYYISWHTSIVCEQFIQCNVVNGSRVIDLSPLVSDRGYYLAQSLTSEGPNTQYYINLCRPLNPIPGVRCPPGSAACVDKDGTLMSLGIVTSGPSMNEGNVAVTYSNGDICPEDKTRNISSVITLFCEKGTSQGTPTMDAYSDCTYHFSWLTNAVCPPSEATSGKDCKYFNDALQYEYDLSSLADDEEQVSGPDLVTYKLHLCNAVSVGQDACQGSAVCMQEGTDVFRSLGTLASQQFYFEGHILKVKYTDGARCDGSATKKRETTIIFKCSESFTLNQPTFFGSDDACHYTFQWDTPLACPPVSMPCDLAYMEKAYDLQPLSQITGNWHFKDDDQNEYFMNLCVPAADCPKEASICRRTPDGTLETLGMVYTQLLRADGSSDKPNIHMTFREGSAGICGKGNTADAESEIIFTCSNKVGFPELKSISTANGADCKFTFVWESKVACSEERVAVELKDNKVTDPETGNTFDLSPLIKKRNWEAEGDERDEMYGQSSVYIYYINLDSGGASKGGDTGGVCTSAAVCQSKKDDSFFRNIGESSQKKFFMQDEILEMVIRNPDSCGKENTQDVESTIIFKCDPNVDLGAPRFYFESSNCQYHFMWETSVLCSKGAQTESPSGGKSGDNKGGATGGKKTSKVPAVMGILLGIVVLCILIIIFHKSERRSAAFYRIRGLFPGAYSKVPNYSYSQLSNGDVEESLLGTNSRTLFSDEEDEDLLKDNRQSNPLEYRDDSDEEILPSI
ncbi:cation-independent mannose-6-phosphate receptor-like [Asterias amurensis]|uniref:cation-independent mannose-6-phosphate receptor-like n=1 Tax=Asterias amurensis TaxID=7602 RepID=UPI003AB52A50